jgi:hypothetical protein
MTSVITQPNTSFAKTEQFNPTMARYLLSQPIDDDDKAKIRKMLKHKERGGFLNINYVLGSKTKQNAFAKQFVGRLFPQGNYGLQTLSGDVRRALAQDVYFDLDIVNAQCEMLNQVAARNGWANMCLSQYCSERDVVFQNIMETTGKSRKEVKVIFISLLFGGSPKDEYGEWIIDCFYPEVKSIMTNLSLSQPELMKHARKKNPVNPVGTCCALFLQTEERKCLLALDTFLTTHGRSMETFIHDGGLVLKLKNETHFPEDLTHQAENFIFSETGYRLKLETKSMQSSFQLPNQVDDDKTYIAVKTKFEKHVFKCISDSSFHETGHMFHKVYSRRDLCTSYEHLKYSAITDGIIVEKKFISEWLEDEQMRTYRYVDTIIPPRLEPDDTFNLYNGLDVEHFEDHTNEDEADIEFLKNHLALLCNNNVELTDYVMKWFAAIFQNPGLKNGVALLFKSSQQGMGKNLWFEIIQIMLGHYAIMVDKPERDLFGHFNGLVEGKLLILLDEFGGRVGYKFSDDLKSLISGSMMDITQKGRESRSVPNMLRLCFNTNNDFPIKIEASDRRFVMADCSSQPVPSKAYFERLAGLKQNKAALKAFYDYLMSLDLTTVDWIRDRPMTEAFRDMRLNSLDTELKFLLSYSRGKSNIVMVSAKDLYNLFLFYLQETRSDMKTNPVKFGLKLKSMCIGGFEKNRGSDGMIYVLNILEFEKWILGRGYDVSDVV